MDAKRENIITYPAMKYDMLPHLNACTISRS